ncbi:M23 family metallopeptidase [Arthrobacter sp. GMC3]|uniref:M23 family metallopeptidase n=1 Tax=Arthrobacter sp. GMC3 TaxID=2058894 RepID=UPI000CE379D5|nr:M23 family metallopeptidase [Arthrobacter sp. GMC3]
MVNYIWPVPEGTGISQAFGADPGGFNPAGGHTGTDFFTVMNTPIRAIAAGAVLHAGWLDGAYWDNPWLLEPSFAGIVVVIDHGPVISIYAHLNRTDLISGDRVTQGEVIGLSGNTRDKVNTFGPHLHFETLPDRWTVNNGTFGRVDPARYCAGYWNGITGQATNITPITPSEEDDMASPEEIAQAVWSHPITLKDGTKGRAIDHFVNLCSDMKQVPKLGTVFKSFDGKTEARFMDIMANLGPDVRAIKTVTDQQVGK